MGKNESETIMTHEFCGDGLA